MQPYLSRPPLQPFQRQAGNFGVPTAAAMGRTLYVPQRPGVKPLRMHDFSGVGAHGTQPHYGHFAGHGDDAYHEPTYANITQALFAEPMSAQPHKPAYQQHSFTAPKVPQVPRRHFPMGPFIIAVIVGVTIVSAWAGYHALTTPDPVNAAPVVYSK